MRFVLPRPVGLKPLLQRLRSQLQLPAMQDLPTVKQVQVAPELLALLVRRALELETQSLRVVAESIEVAVQTSGT